MAGRGSVIDPNHRRMMSPTPSQLQDTVATAGFSSRVLDVLVPTGTTALAEKEQEWRCPG